MLLKKIIKKFTTQSIQDLYDFFNDGLRVGYLLKQLKGILVSPLQCFSLQIIKIGTGSPGPIYFTEMHTIGGLIGSLTGMSVMNLKLSILLMIIFNFITGVIKII